MKPDPMPANYNSIMWMPDNKNFVLIKLRLIANHIWVRKGFGWMMSMMPAFFFFFCINPFAALI